MCWLSWNLGASTSWYPQGLSRPVMGLLYLYSTAAELCWGVQYNEESVLKTCTFFLESISFISPLCILNDFNDIVCLLDFVWFELADYCCRLLHTPAPSIHQFYGQWTGTQSKAARSTSRRSAPCHTGTWESGAGCKESEQKGTNLTLFILMCFLNSQNISIIEPLRTVRPIYGTGVPLPSRCCILYIFFNKIST